MPPITHLLWQLIRYAQRLYWVDTLLWLFILGLPAVPGLIIREFFDTLTGDSRFSASPWVWIGLLLAVGLARVVAIFVGRITKTQHRFLISGLVRHNLLHELLKRPGAELATGGANGQNASPGEILSYFRDDAAQIEDVVVGTNEIFAAGVFAMGSVALLISVNPTMTLLVFLPLCAIALLAHQAEHRLKRYRRASRQATQQVTGLIGELFTAVQAVKVAGAEAQMLEELRKRCDRRRDLMVRDQVFSAILNSGFENIVSIGTGLILLVASQSLGAQGDLTVGDFALFVYYLSFVTYFLAFLGGFIATIKQSEVSFERMAGLVCDGARKLDEQRFEFSVLSSQLKDFTQNSKLKIQNSHPLTHPHPLYLKPILGPEPALPSRVDAIVNDRPMASAPLHELRVEGLTYRYPGGGGISDISFTLTQGSLTVITGRVGAGKTTLLRVLLGLLPKQSGALHWNGQPILDPANFLVPPRAAYTPQIPQLFSASLRENLLLGQAVGPQQLDRAIATAVFDRDLAAMPDGLETLIGTRGFRLSGGQKQRAAAARMLLRQPALMIFDDLSSALDVETEQRLWEQLFTPSTHPPIYPSTLSPTCLVVSHRPSVLDRADQILFLENGRIESVT
ncbi:ATP-binding cassette domain-containing protein [Phormidium tenue]|uniref:ABC transporter ATP-binding protein n=1 Tax=Phormidium tenue NIES-30 TaxID=549789 RepID=A0A1U7J4R3_9CYAN|nr:ABC transporter ATP-binding protein [Phormidium tenue]MBD2232803.1 ABC transporter ATP-binding protein [Phormidium tenue FACHB-1052]OKH47504.1 ABC transporter ATP-binding protein [Phormidium tenue NIES-30]